MDDWGKLSDHVLVPPGGRLPIWPRVQWGGDGNKAPSTPPKRRSRLDPYRSARGCGRIREAQPMRALGSGM